MVHRLHMVEAWRVRDMWRGWFIIQINYNHHGETNQEIRAASKPLEQKGEEVYSTLCCEAHDDDLGDYGRKRGALGAAVGSVIAARWLLCTLHSTALHQRCTYGSANTLRLEISKLISRVSGT
jgi:hypothetical protein